MAYSAIHQVSPFLPHLHPPSPSFSNSAFSLIGDLKTVRPHGLLTLVVPYIFAYRYILFFFLLACHLTCPATRLFLLLRAALLHLTPAVILLNSAYLKVFVVMQASTFLEFTHPLPLMKTVSDPPWSFPVFTLLLDSLAFSWLSIVVFSSLT